MQVNKEEVINIIFALISVAISSYILGLMPHGIRKSVYQIIISTTIFAIFYCINKGILFLINKMKSK